MINFKGGAITSTTNIYNQSKYVDSNAKFIFLETHLFHSKKTLDSISTDTIVEYITEFTDYYNRVYREKNNKIICKRLLQCILKLVRVVWLDKKSSSDAILIVIDSMFKLILNVELRDSIDQNNLVAMLDLLCQNRFFSQNRRLVEPLSPLSPTRMLNSNIMNNSNNNNNNNSSNNLNILSPNSTSPIHTPTKSSYYLNTPFTPFTPNSSSGSFDDSFSDISSQTTPPIPIPFNHIVNPNTLKESYILLIPLLFLYCKNDKNYRELKKFFGSAIIENETFQYFTTYWSVTSHPDDQSRCSNFILSLGNNSYLLKDNKLIFLNTIFNIINSYDLLKEKGIECLELHLNNFLDTEQFYERIILEIYKHKDRLLNILKKLLLASSKDQKMFVSILEPHFSKLSKLFIQSSSFEMLNVLIKSVIGKSFFKQSSSMVTNEYLNKLIQIVVSTGSGTGTGGDGVLNGYKKYQVLESIVYIIRLHGGVKEMGLVGHIRILMKHFRMIEFILLDDANTLVYESIIRSLVQLYRLCGDNYIQLFYISINSIVKSLESKHTGSMVILGEILNEFTDQLRITDIQFILKFIGSICLCKRDIFPIFLDFYYRHSSWYEFNCYIERILQKDIKLNIDDNFSNITNNTCGTGSGGNGGSGSINISISPIVGNENNIIGINEDEDDGENNNQDDSNQDCKIKSFINALHFLRVIGKYCPNAYTTDSQRERITKIYNGIIEKLPQSVVNVFMFAGNKKSVRFIHLLIPQLTSLIQSLPSNDDIYSNFMQGVLNCIYTRKRQHSNVNITPFIELMLILNNEYVPGSKSIHYDSIIKQSLLFYKNYGTTSIVGSNSSSNDFSLFIDRRNPRFLLFLNQVLPLSSYKFLKKLVLSYPAQLSQSSGFKKQFEKLTLRNKESIVKIIQSSSSYNPSLSDLLKSLKRPMMPLLVDSVGFRDGYRCLIECIYRSCSDIPSEWKMTLCLVCKDWFEFASNQLNTCYQSARSMKIKTSIKPGTRFCLFTQLIHFSFTQILTYPMNQWCQLFSNAQSIDLIGCLENDLERHLNIFAEISSFPNLKSITLDSISSDSSSYNRIIDNISSNQSTNQNLQSISLSLASLSHSEVDNVIEFFQSILKTCVNPSLVCTISIGNSTCDYWLLPLVNELYQLFSTPNNNKGKIYITSPYPDDKFLSIHNKKSSNELQRYFNQCSVLTFTPDLTHSYELFDYYPLANTLETLVIDNCTGNHDNDDTAAFGIYFEINLLALLENSSVLSNLVINNVTEISQVVELFSCLPLNRSLRSITLIINTKSLVTDNMGNQNLIDGIFSGSYFENYLVEIFQLLNLNQSIENLFISTHNKLPLLDDYSNLVKSFNACGDFNLINPCQFQRSFKKLIKK